MYFAIMRVEATMRPVELALYMIISFVMLCRGTEDEREDEAAGVSGDMNFPCTVHNHHDECDSSKDADGLDAA